MIETWSRWQGHCLHVYLATLSWDYFTGGGGGVGAPTIHEQEVKISDPLYYIYIYILNFHPAAQGIGIFFYVRHIHFQNFRPPTLHFQNFRPPIAKNFRPPMEQGGISAPPCSCMAPTSRNFCYQNGGPQFERPPPRDFWSKPGGAGRPPAKNFRDKNDFQKSNNRPKMIKFRFSP